MCFSLLAIGAFNFELPSPAASRRHQLSRKHSLASIPKYSFLKITQSDCCGNAYNVSSKIELLDDPECASCCDDGTSCSEQFPICCPGSDDCAGEEEYCCPNSTGGGVCGRESPRCCPANACCGADESCCGSGCCQSGTSCCGQGSSATCCPGGHPDCCHESATNIDGEGKIASQNVEWHRITCRRLGSWFRLLLLAPFDFYLPGPC